MPADADATQGKIDRADVLDAIRTELAEILEVDGSTIGEGDSLAEDLHLGSLELIELVEALEERFAEVDPAFRVDDEDLDGLRSVRDAVDYVVARL